VIASEGRSHPLEVVHLGRGAEQRIEDATAAAVRQGDRRGGGGVLAFLPGVAEIERTAERLALPQGVDLHRLHGSLEPGEQRAAIAAPGAGRRKVVLATSIAETSLTLDGVRIVHRFGTGAATSLRSRGGLTRLVTERASQAAVTQRAGRAARQAPGASIACGRRPRPRACRASTRRR
jgi:ATP-dependent helicase HrpB